MRPRRVARRLWRGATLVGIGLAGSAAVVTARHLLLTPQPLESGLPGEARIDRRHGGAIYYTVAGPQDAQPIVLLHDFYVGASSYEFRLVFARLAEAYRVYAPDWLGFGMSERPALTHTGEFYASMLQGFVRDEVGAPVAVVAHGLAANIAVRAAADAPDLFSRLTLVAPDGEAGVRLDPTPGQTAIRLMQKLALGLTPYAFASLRPALRLAAGRRSAAGAREVDAATLDHLFASSHQFGGEHAALSLFTGELDLPIANVFPLLRTPSLIMIGARDQRHPLPEMERLVALNRDADLEMVANAGEAVFLDQPTLFINTLHRWLSRRLAHRDQPSVAPPTVAPTVSPRTPLAAMPTAPGAAAMPVPATPVRAEAGAETQVAMQTPVARPARIVPVLEPAPPSDPQPPHQPTLELEAHRTPDGEAMDNATDALDATRPLSLEPTSGKSGSQANDPTVRPPRSETLAGRPLGQSPGRPLGVRPAQASAAQGGAYLYSPALGAHVLRSDRYDGDGVAPRHTRGRRQR